MLGFGTSGRLTHLGILAMLAATLMTGVVTATEPTHPLSATPANQGIFVGGEGEVTIKPDVAFVTLGVETQYRTALEAQRENARLLTQVATRLVALGIQREMIETANFSLWPVRSYNKSTGGEQVVGYRVSNQVVVRVTDLNKVGPVVDAAVGAGANNVQGIVFLVRDMAAAKAEALALAARDARNKAEALAGSMGLTLDGIISMADQSVAINPPRLMKALSLAGAEGAYDTPVSPGDLKVRATVQVNFAIR